MNNNKQGIIATLLILCATIIFFEFSSLDLKIQTYLYDFEKGAWLIDKNETISRLIFYDGIKVVYALFVILLTFSLAFLSKYKILFENQQGIKIIFLSTLLIPLTINALKAITSIPCPSDLIYFNGDQSYIRLLDWVQQKSIVQDMRCYPAGHASGGFALMSFYFLFESKKNKYIVLGLTASLGWIIGFYKMLIGDHFFSHTLVSMEISWLIILVITMFIPIKRKTISVNHSTGSLK